MSLPSALHVAQRFAVDGEYTFRGILRGLRPAGSDPVELGFWIDGKMVHEAKIAGARPRSKPGGAREKSTACGRSSARPITAGEHWLSVTVQRMYEGLPAAYKGPKPVEDPRAEVGNARASTPSSPCISTSSGPTSRPKARRAESVTKDLRGQPGQGPRDAAAARKILADLARRAFRRPVTDQEVDDLVKLVAMVQKDGDSFEEGLCLAIQRILISPHFLFRVERGRRAA